MRKVSGFGSGSSPPQRCWGLLWGLLFIVSVQISEVSGGRRLVKSAASNPFTPKGYLLRYWEKQIGNGLPGPGFLMEKASPLTAAQYAAFSKIAGDGNALSEKLPEFCAEANLLCFPDLSQSLEKHGSDVSFANYMDQNFTSYGNDRRKGTDEFRSYSENDNVVVDTFRRYSRGSTDHKDKFGAYATESNVVDQSFNTYGTGATGGEGQFKNYGYEVNVPDLTFTSYSDRGNGRDQKFSAYSTEANAGDEGFASYGKNGKGADNTFTSYGNESNVIGSSFKNYGENGNRGKDKFTSYGENGNVPENNFHNYGAGGEAATDTFKNYRDQSNVGDDGFDSYGKKSHSAEIGFVNYGQSFNEGTDKFTGYGKDSTAATVDFKIYGVNNTFKEYDKAATTTFSSYLNETYSAEKATAASDTKKVSKWVEPGKFFREAMLKQGSLMPMPDIRDKMPRRSFLPRGIVSKLPFSSSKMSEIKKIFHASDESSISKMATDALHDCERAPSPDETKRCVASIEDMIDFATSVLGRSVAVRTTDSTAGANSQILLGEVKGINGGKVTKSVSCHQSLYPYLLYYCHSVPKVRVYEADILDPNTRSKINHGVAICHLDTSSWSPDHGAFVALGPSPGKIEVCHWIFENDMTWAAAD